MAQSESILVIDDAPAVGASLKRTLTDRGHSVKVVRTGEHGLRLIRQSGIALVLLDLKLPDMDGLSVLREIQTLADPPDVIICTGHATLESAIEASERGSVGYLVKPIDPARLDGIVRRVLERRNLLRDNARLFEAADQERRRLHVLYDVSRRLAEARETDEVLSLLVNEATRLLGAEAAGIRLLEGDDELVLRARTESATRLMARPRMKVGESLSGRLVATGQPIAVTDLVEDTRWDPAHKRGAIAQGFHGFLGVPLTLHGRVIGALSVFTRKRREFTPDEVSLLSAFADQAALAIHNAGLLHEAEESRQLVEQLYRVAVSMQDSWSVEERLRAFVRGAREAVGFDRIYVFLSTVDGDLVLATPPEEDETAPPTLPLSPAAGPFFQVVQSRQAIAVLRQEDLATIRPIAPIFRAHPFFRSKRFVIAPLVVGQRVIGVVGADNKRTQRPIPPASIEPLVLLCQQLATALESARLYTESQAREREVSRLYEVTRHLASSLDFGRILDEITAKTVDLLGSDASAIYMWDEAQGSLLFQRGINLGRRQLVLKPGEGVAGRAFQSRQVEWTRDRLADPSLSYSQTSDQIITADAPRGIVGVPIISRGEVLGVLVGHFFSPHDFLDKEIQLLSTLADQAAIALEHARHYEEVRTQQTRLAQILDSTSDGILLIGRDGRIEAANRQAGDLLGFDPVTVVGRGLAELMAGYRSAIPDFEQTAAALQALTREPDREAQGEFELRTDARIVQWAGRPTRAASGTTVGFTLTLHDVTHEREVSQMKSDFVSFVTHQLRTPLAGIKWMLELAAQEPAMPDEAGSYVQDARHAAQRLVELVNDLLDISRLEQGRLSIVPQEVRLDELTQSVVDETGLLLRDKGHHLSVAGKGEIPPVRTDPQLLRQVVMNLVSNAIKYTPPGGDIAIEMVRERGVVRWSIRDSGIGVPKAAQARLFEKFYRADNVTTVETEGTGLGLYLVRLIMERCGGRVWCESEEGQGSTFRFTLPVEGG